MVLINATKEKFRVLRVQSGALHLAMEQRKLRKQYLSRDVNDN